jgi:hypothetical protein
MELIPKKTRDKEISREKRSREMENGSLLYE